MRRRVPETAAFLTVLLLAAPARSAVYPGDSWETRTPQQAGMRSARLDQLAASVGGDGVIVRDGYMVYSWGDVTARHGWASATKPIVSTLLLFAIQEGRLDGADDLVEPYAQEVFEEDLLPKDQGITFRHLANMTSGYGRVEGPGEAWAYNDWAIALYFRAFAQGVYGANMNPVATDPARLGVLDLEDGNLFSGEWVRTSVRDAARVGWFWLNRGRWKGKHLSSTLFDAHARPQVPADLPRSEAEHPEGDYLDASGGRPSRAADQTPQGPGIYGFHWWFNPLRTTWPEAPADTFQANGHWNQKAITVIPSLGIVAAWVNLDVAVDRENFPEWMDERLGQLVDAVVVVADAACNDGIDNDGDGHVDFPQDIGCALPGSEEAPPCQDGLDNDGDGGIDFDGGVAAGRAHGTRDLTCVDPWSEGETLGGGLGAELVVPLAALALARRLRSRRGRAD